MSTSRTSFLSFKYYDFLGSEFKLKYKTSGKYKTVVGGVLSVLTAFATLIAFTVIIKKSLATDSPEVSIVTNFVQEYPVIDLYSEGFFNSYGLLVGRGILPSSEIFKYITIVSQIIKVDKNEDGFLVPFMQPVIPYVLCTSIDNPDLLKLFNLEPGVAEAINKNGVCPNLTKEHVYFVRGKIGDPPRYTLETRILPCSLPDPSDCIDMGIARNVKLHFSKTKKILNFTNFEEPVKISYDIDSYLSLLPAQTKDMKITLKTTEIWDDTKDFSANSLRIKYADVDEMIQNSMFRDTNQRYCTQFEIQTFQCHEYMKFYIYSTGKHLKIIRTYPKLFRALARMGGVSGLFTLVAATIYSNYNKNHVKRYLKGKLFKKENQEEILRLLFPDLILKDQKLKPSKSVSTKAIVGKTSIFNRGSSNKEALILAKEKESVETISQIVEINLAKNEDGATLLKKLNLMTLMEKIFFEEPEQVLLPLVLLNMEKKEFMRRKKIKNLKKKILSNLSKGAVHHRSDTSSQKKTMELLKEEDPKVPMSIKEAYTNLTESVPKNDIKQHIKNFILTNLPEMKFEEKEVELKFLQFQDFEDSEQIHNSENSSPSPSNKQLSSLKVAVRPELASENGTNKRTFTKFSENKNIIFDSKSKSSSSQKLRVRKAAFHPIKKGKSKGITSAMGIVSSKGKP